MTPELDKLSHEWDKLADSLGLTDNERKVAMKIAESVVCRANDEMLFFLMTGKIGDGRGKCVIECAVGMASKSLEAIR